MLYQMRRRAKARTAKVAAMDEVFDLDQLERNVSAAAGKVDEMMRELFAAQFTFDMTECRPRLFSATVGRRLCDGEPYAQH